MTNYDKIVRSKVPPPQPEFKDETDEEIKHRLEKIAEARKKFMERKRKREEEITDENS